MVVVRVVVVVRMMIVVRVVVGVVVVVRRRARGAGVECVVQMVVVGGRVAQRIVVVALCRDVAA